MVSGALYLEMACELGTDTVVNAFCRMMNHWGVPLELVSANGTNFEGGEKELGKLVETLDKDKIQKSASCKGLKQNFNLPLAPLPHFGDICVSNLKSAIWTIKAVLGNTYINDDGLWTIFIGTEIFWALDC